MESSLTVRLAVPQDAEAVHAIYAPYVTDSVATFEIEPPSVEEVRNRISQTLRRYPFLVAQRDGEVVAFSYASALRGRPAYDWSVETTIYAAPQAIGTGAAAALYQRLEELLVLQGVHNLYACIADPNPVSERFHEKQGFVRAGAFANCGYKHGKWLGITWWEKQIGTRMVHPEPVRFGCWE